MTFTDEQIRAAYAAIGCHSELCYPEEQARALAEGRRLLEASSDFDARTIACALGWGNPAAADYLRRAAGVPTCEETGPDPAAAAKWTVESFAEELAADFERKAKECEALRPKWPADEQEYHRLSGKAETYASAAQDVRRLLKQVTQ